MSLGWTHQGCIEGITPPVATGGTTSPAPPVLYGEPRASSNPQEKITASSHQTASRPVFRDEGVGASPTGVHADADGGYVDGGTAGGELSHQNAVRGRAQSPAQGAASGRGHAPIPVHRHQGRVAETAVRPALQGVPLHQGHHLWTWDSGGWGRFPPAVRRGEKAYSRLCEPCVRVNSLRA